MQAHADLIDELGGGTAVAKAVWGGIGSNGRFRERVYKWKENGVPWRFRPILERLAHERGVALPPDFLAAHAPPDATEAA